MKYIKLFENFSSENNISDLDDFYMNEYKLIDSKDDFYEDIQLYIKQAIKIFKNKFKIFKNIEVRVFKKIDILDNGGLGMYSHESAVSGDPYVMINYDGVLTEYDNGYDMDMIIITTILHELGHAVVDIDNAYILDEKGNILNFDDEEEFVEDFAYNLYNYNKIDSDFIKLESAYLTKLEEGDLEINEDYM